MQTTKSHGLDWRVGSNGTTFTDQGGFRYCIIDRPDGGYNLTRDGIVFAKAASMADGKLAISRECR